MSYLYKKLEKLNNVAKNESSHIWAWKNMVELERNHLLLTKRERMISYFTKNYKDESFFLYKSGSSYLKSRNNINNIFNVNSLDDYLYKNKKLGFVLLDTESFIQMKNWLNLFKNYFDEKTIFFVPNLVNTKNYENKSIIGILEFCKENSLNLEWVSYYGKVKLYDINENGFDEGACFKFN